jgi:hypothetical protein
MKSLIEVSKIVSRKKVRKIEIIDDAILDNTSSKFSEFYNGLMAGKFRNDRDAATMLYQCSPTHDKYRQLKSRFRRRLLNTLFFIDVNLPKTSSYERAYYSCHKEWTLVNILMLNEAHSTAMETARQILTTALKFKFADLILHSARTLRAYAASEGNQKEFDFYDSLVKEYTDIDMAENRSEEMFQRVQIKYGQPVIDSEVFANELENQWSALLGMSETYDSPIIMFNTLLAWVLKFEISRDYEHMLHVCERAEQYIEQNPNYLQESKLAAFHLKKMAVFLHLRDFAGGRKSIEKSLHYFPEGSDLWFVFMEYYILLAFHTQNQIQALAILNKTKSQPKFKKLDSETREKWRIFEVYVNYFVGLDNEELLKIQNKGSFSVAQFVRDPLLYPRVYRIFTVHMVIAQILFLLENNQQSAAERIDRIRLYSIKQLYKEENARMILFIKLLVQLAKSDFKVNSLTTASKYFEQLNTVPFMYRGNMNELEIVPFEILWNHILSRL